MWLLILFILLGLTSCGSHQLTVQRFVVTPENLPSQFVGAPDPDFEHPVIGQRLFVSYKIKKMDQEAMPYFLTLKVIYKNLEEETKTFTIFRDEGKQEFAILNEAFEATGGILTYKADLTTVDGEQIAEFKHRLWFELISFE